MTKEKGEDYFERVEAMEEYVEQLELHLALISGGEADSADQ